MPLLRQQRNWKGAVEKTTIHSAFIHPVFAEGLLCQILQEVMGREIMGLGLSSLIPQPIGNSRGLWGHIAGCPRMLGAGLVLWGGKGAVGSRPAWWAVPTAADTTDSPN